MRELAAGKRHSAFCGIGQDEWYEVDDSRITKGERNDAQAEERALTATPERKAPLGTFDHCDGEWLELARPRTIRRSAGAQSGRPHSRQRRPDGNPLWELRGRVWA
jgi:hypothetical protein